ncbi:PHP domain-containing protein [Candidatus Villigracilis affinis]|uniref:PHP domain-containing protein n=1 Tax=Candidatus Villigracilis affinis TaxID=3140682 RepID=UPI001D91FBD5|nr:DNA polymerase III subunit alpha [Anaerolineales bacterium]
MTFTSDNQLACKTEDIPPNRLQFILMVLHLTCHSSYSLQEGLATPVELIQAAQSYGMSALGLTDHNLLTGSIEFVTACRDAGIQPILGLEIDFEERPLQLLATSFEGWSNLCRLSSAIALNTPCSLELLASHSKDLIALSGNPKPLIDIFGDRLYFALSDPAQVIPRFANPVAVHPIYYLHPEQAVLQRTLTAIRLNQTVEKIPVHSGMHFPSPQEMEHRFVNFPEALSATHEIAERCRFDFPLNVPRMPTVSLPKGVTAAEHLREKAFSGARALYGEVTPIIQERLNHELDTIARMGFEPIFLIVEDILNFARETGVPFSSRGSAASSLVAHCLGITSPDPLRLNLYFERFLNPARTTPPDIDTDLCSRRRDSVIEHVFDAYGAERVAMVGTINRYRPRSALADVAKAHGLLPEPNPRTGEPASAFVVGTFRGN